MPKVESGEELRAKCAERRARNPVGRPKGGSLAVQKLNELVNSKDFDEGLEAMKEVIKDPDHRSWAPAMKMILDREAHLSHYEKGGNSGKPLVNITIGDNTKGITIDQQEKEEKEKEEEE